MTEVDASGGGVEAEKLASTAPNEQQPSVTLLGFILISYETNNVF